MRNDAIRSTLAKKRLGEKIRHLRLGKSMALAELGRHTGLSAGFLSQLENEKIVPTLQNLTRIAMVFSKDLDYFFRDEPLPIISVHRRGDRVRLPQSTKSRHPAFFFESLGFQVPDRPLDPYWAKVMPRRSGMEDAMHRHPGMEFLYVVSGSVELRFSDSAHTLSRGDSVLFDCSRPHAYSSADRSAAEVLVVISGVGSVK